MDPLARGHRNVTVIYLLIDADHAFLRHFQKRKEGHDDVIAILCILNQLFEAEYLTDLAAHCLEDQAHALFHGGTLAFDTLVMLFDRLDLVFFLDKKTERSRELLDVKTEIFIRILQID